MGILEPSNAGLTADQIARLVDRFYDKIQLHPTLGPVFNARVKDWEAHKRLLTSFWCSVALRANSYRGNPMAVHRPLPIDGTHFQDWLALWVQTTHDLLDERAAGQMVEYADRIGRSLQAGLGLRSGSRPLNLTMQVTTAPTPYAQGSSQG